MKTINTVKALQIIKAFVAEASAEKPLVIAIDGRAASGKSTFAFKLQKEINSPVICTDDFFRPRKNGIVEISEYSGNFDIERFKTEIVKSVLHRKPLEYGVFDCKQGIITHNIILPQSDVYIVEGAYSLHPMLSEYADLKLFFTVSSEVQKNRIVTRNGENGYNNFKNTWIPAEERYLTHFDIESTCDYIVDTSKEVQNEQLQL